MLASAVWWQRAPCTPLAGGIAWRAQWIGYYNAQRPHSSLGEQTPNEACAAIGVAEQQTLAA